MRTVLAATSGGDPPVGIGVVIAAVLASIVVLAIVLSARERRKLSELLEYADSHGWHAVPDPIGLPPPVAEAALSKRSMLFRRYRTWPLWISWHRWTETSRSSTFNSSTQRWESRTTSITHDLTRYFMVLPGNFPDMVVHRRDRQLVVKPPEAMLPEAIPPELRQALLAGTVPPFGIAGNVLTTRYDDRPFPDDLQLRAEEVKRLALMLTPSHRSRQSRS